MNTKGPIVSFILSVVVSVLMAFPGYGQGKAPEKEKPKPAPQQKSAKQDANESMDDLEHSLRKAGKAAKEGANEGLEAIDRTVHEIIDSPPKK